ncbi:hypothetical protein FCL47_00975 [Desulfopila sp. IMCC35006]|uniref:hypothetical protein n=1 Tax=Desulfopila sp. IMCC35006 TaxID=2569542 RepID=UPI0010AD4BEC|nr:hypothetical protein [Desulfopila sp. IMCC35006]TKB28095.1 hypothetical protein FCL47_00975 [Desulfopila sp. IMCC35006]
MKQYTGNQYDDDLTVGTEDYDDSYYTGSVDFFEFATDDESPISRLKSLILSIDWEITDEILMQFNEELIDLRDIWAGEKINLVYVQALEKISKYIYQKKANSHPSAIKLLLTLYHNLEKIVSSYDLTEEQKKEILIEDVKRFESLKRHIGQNPQVADMEMQPEQPKQKNRVEHISSDKDLLTLKAIVLGIDWEITDQDLNALRQEVVRLDEKFSGSRPKLILLQGIGTLAAYIKLKKSNAHADAFKLLHLFYDSLEKIVATPRKLDEEKAILVPAVEKFNAFKALLGPTIAAEAISRDEDETEEDGEVSSDSITLAPAFADLPEEDVKGFQAEEEAQALGLESSGNIDNHVDSFFLGESVKNLEAQNYPGVLTATDGEMQKDPLQGVNVEIDDEEETDGLSFAGGNLTPALSSVIEEDENVELSPALEKTALPVEDELVLEESIDWPAENAGDTSVAAKAQDDDTEQAGFDFSKLDPDIALQGVDVETDADDDSDEEALPLMGGKLAPALAANDEVSIYNAAIFEESTAGVSVDDEIAGTLGGFFDEEIASHLSPTPAGDVQNDQAASIAVDAKHEKNTNEIEDAGQLDALNADNDFAQSPAEGLGADNFDMPAEIEQEADIAAINEQLDSFFDLEEDVVQTDGDLFLETEPEIAADSAPAEEKVVAPIAEDFEEEVVFELVQEEDEPAGITHDRDNISLPDSTERSDMFQSLQSCVDALGVELDERVIASLWQEIDNLYQNLADKPLEKTFLQLLSTVVRHIDQNRYDSSTEAYKLLQSICTGLGTLQNDNVFYNQEMLLSETHKVLKWQEQLFQELVARNEAELTIVDEDAAEESMGDDAVQETLFAGEEIETEDEGLHEEISTLRQTLQDEIAELRKELKDS